MARKKNRSPFKGAADILAQGIISVRKLGAFFRETNRGGKRAQKETQRAARELWKERTDKQVAQELGISRQKATSLRKRVQEGKAYSPELKEVLRQADRELSARPARETRAQGPEGFYIPEVRDGRSRKGTQKAAKELWEGRTNKEVAKQLGISPQKASRIRKAIESGDLYSPELKDELKSARLDYEATPQKMENGVYFFPDIKKLKKFTKVDIIKTFGFLDDALEWWESVVSSDTYIAITEQNGSYHVVGLGKRGQRPTRGKSYERGKGNRVKQLISKYKNQ